MIKNLVSILMCAYNEPEEYISKSIESIIMQTYTDIEYIIICDNPNNQELIKIIKQYEKKDRRIKIIINEKNIGLVESLNKAIRICNGEYIARMDADDIAIYNRIELQKEYLVKNKLDIIGSGVACINEQGKRISILNRYPASDRKLNKKILFNNCMPHPTWFGKREVFINNNGYRNIEYAEDYDFILRGLTLGYKMGNINEVLLEYRIRENSISKTNGLCQYITFCRLRDFYKADNIKELSKIKKKINDDIKAVNDDQYSKYSKAAQYFAIAASEFRKKKLKGLIYLFKSISISKYYRKKIYSYFRGIIW